MSKIVALNIHNQIHQVELVDLSIEEVDTIDYQILHHDDENYSEIKNSFDETEVAAFENAVENGQLFFRITPIQYFFTLHDVDENNNSAHIENKNLATNFSESILENYYRLTDNKEEFLNKLESKKIQYLVYAADDEHLPENAFPLFTLSATESSEIKAESKQLMQSIRFKNGLHALGESFRLLINYSIENPVQVIGLLLVTYFATVVAQSPSDKQKIDEENLINELEKLVSEGKALKQYSNDYMNAFNEEISANSVIKKHIAEFDIKINAARTLLESLLKDPVKLEKYLILALENDDLGKFKVALDGYDIRKKSLDGKRYIFSFAAKYNSLKIAEYAVETLGIDLNHFQPDETIEISDFMIIQAIDNNNFEMAKKLVDWKLDLNYGFGEERSTLLHGLATRASAINLRRIKHLIQLGADINTPDLKGVLPVFVAAKSNLDAMKLFLDNPGCHTKKIDLENGLLINLLSYCFQYSSLETVEYLLKRNFDPYLNAEKMIQGKVDDVPIISAIERGDTKYLDLILQHNIKLNQHKDFSFFQLYTCFPYKIDIAYYLVRHGVGIDSFEKAYQRVHKLADAAKWLNLCENFIFEVKQWKRYSKEYQALNKTEQIYIRKYIHSDMQNLEIPEFNLQFENYKKYLAERMKDQSEDREDNDNILSRFIKSRNEYHLSRGYTKRILTVILALIISAIIYVNRHLLSRVMKINNNAQERIDNAEHQVKKNKNIKKTSLSLEEESGQKNKKTIEIQESVPKPELSKKDKLKLESVNQYINHCEYEIKLFNANDECLYIQNRYNSFEKYKNKVVVVENGYTKNSQILLKEKIAALKAICNLVASEIKLNSQAMGSQGKQLLLDTQVELGNFKNDLMNPPESDSCKILIPLDLPACKNKIERLTSIRDEMRKSLKEVGRLIDEIEDLEEKIERLRIRQGKSIVPEKIIIVENKIEQPEPEIVLTIADEKPVIICNKSTQQHSLFTKKSSIIKTGKKIKMDSLVNTKSIDTVDYKKHIRDDARLKNLLEKFEAIESIRHNNKVEDLWKMDAIHYLLMKTAHLISGLLSDYKTIITDTHNSHILMLNLRNNIAHYHTTCNISQSFLEVYSDIFYIPLKELHENGRTEKMIKLDNLINTSNERDKLICDFIFTAQPNAKNMRFSYGDIIRLCHQADLYHKEAINLGEKFTFGTLDCAMRAILFKLRDPLKWLRKNHWQMYQKINNTCPDFYSVNIDRGNKIAHRIDAENLWDIEMEYYYSKDEINSLAVMSCMREIRDIGEIINGNEEKIVLMPSASMESKK